MGVDGPRPGVDGDAVDGLQQLAPGEHPIGRARPCGRAGRTRTPSASTAGRRRSTDAPRRVDDEAAEVTGRSSSTGGAPRAARPARAPAARGAERLDDVVVGAELQPDDPVGLVGAGGQHDDRHRGRWPHRAGHVEAVDAGQAEVEHDEVGHDRAERGAGPPRPIAPWTRGTRRRPGSRGRWRRCPARRRRRARGSSADHRPSSGPVRCRGDVGAVGVRPGGASPAARARRRRTAHGRPPVRTVRPTAAAAS